MIEFIWDIVVVTNDCMKEDVIYYNNFVYRACHDWCMRGSRLIFFDQTK